MRYEEFKDTQDLLAGEFATAIRAFQEASAPEARRLIFNEAQVDEMVQGMDPETQAQAAEAAAGIPDLPWGNPCQGPE